MSASESHRKTDVTAHAKTDRVNKTGRTTSAEEIVDTSGQYESRGELEKPFDELKASEDKFRVMVDTVPALLWWDPADGSNEFLNQRWHEYTGVSQEESQGSGWQVAFHPEDLVKVFDKWQAVPATGEPAEIELEARLRRFDGEYRWFRAPFNGPGLGGCTTKGLMARS
jgi:PAS domain S-box-containing protein